MQIIGRISDRKCPECGKGFRAAGRRKYCGDRCADSALQKQKEERRKAKPLGTGIGERPCSICGRDFLSRGVRHVYCGPDCQRVGLARAVEAQHQRRLAEKADKNHGAPPDGSGAVDPDLRSAVAEPV